MPGTFVGECELWALCGEGWIHLWRGRVMRARL